MAGKADPVKYLFVAALVLSARASPPLAGGQGDVIIAAHPERLTLFNAYQQRLSVDDGRALAAYEPMVLVRERDLLGDGFTPCMRVIVNGELVFLQTGADGNPLENGGPAGLVILRGVNLLGDTIVARKTGGLTLKAYDGRTSWTVYPGSVIVRLFLHEGNTYVRLASRTPRFGWMALTGANSGDWSRRRTPREPASDVFANALPGIRAMVDDANAALRNIYARFHETSTRATAAPPCFILEVQDDALRCTLQPGRRARAFGESIRALGGGIERLFPEGAVRVDIADSLITVVKR